MLGTLKLLEETGTSVSKVCYFPACNHTCWEVTRATTLRELSRKAQPVLGNMWRGPAPIAQPTQTDDFPSPYFSQSKSLFFPTPCSTKANFPHSPAPGSGPSPRPQSDSPRHQGAERAADRECRGQARCADSFCADGSTHLQDTERPLFPLVVAV